MDRSVRVEQALAQVQLRPPSPMDHVHPIIDDLRRHIDEDRAKIQELETLDCTDQGFERKLQFYLARALNARVLLIEAQIQTQNLSRLSAEMKASHS